MNDRQLQNLRGLPAYWRGEARKARAADYAYGAERAERNATAARHDLSVEITRRQGRAGIDRVDASNGRVMRARWDDVVALATRHFDNVGVAGLQPGDVFAPFAHTPGYSRSVYVCERVVAHTGNVHAKRFARSRGACLATVEVFHPEAAS